MDKNTAIERLSDIRNVLESELNELIADVERFQNRLAHDSTMANMKLFPPTRNFLVNGRTDDELSSGEPETLERYRIRTADANTKIKELIEDTCHLLIMLFTDDLIDRPASLWRLIKLRGQQPEPGGSYLFWATHIVPGFKADLAIVGDGAFSHISNAIKICDWLERSMVNSGGATYEKPEDYERDKWIYDNIHVNSHESMKENFNEMATKERWSRVTSVNRFKALADRFAKFHTKDKRRYKDPNNSD